MSNERTASTGDPAGSHPKDRETLRPVFIRIDPEQLVILKYVVESYDFLGIIRTLNRESGEIVILAVEDTVEELHRVLESIREEVGFVITPPPKSICQDWLLSETYPELGR